MAGADQTIVVIATIIKFNKISLESCAGAYRLSRKKTPYIKQQKCAQFISGVLLGFACVMDMQRIQFFGQSLVQFHRRKSHCGKNNERVRRLLRLVQ